MLASLSVCIFCSFCCSVASIQRKLLINIHPHPAEEAAFLNQKPQNTGKKKCVYMRVCVSTYVWYTYMYTFMCFTSSTQLCIVSCLFLFVCLIFFNFQTSYLSNTIKITVNCKIQSKIRL